MNDTNTPGVYAALDELLNRIGSPLGPAESHGLLCGLFCAAREDVFPLWRDQLVGDAPLEAEEAERLRLLAEETWRQLEDAELGFAVLLPGDDERLSERALALGEWCHGFLVGLGLGQPGETDNAAVKEVLADLNQISTVSAQPEDCAGEEDENSYAELVEYVRVAVLMVKEQLRSTGPPAPESPSPLH